MLWSTNFATKFYFSYQELIKPFKIFVWKETQVCYKVCRKTQNASRCFPIKHKIQFPSLRSFGGRKEKGSAHTGLCTSSSYPIFLMNYNQKTCERFIGWIGTLLWGEAGDASPWWGRFTDTSFPLTHLWTGSLLTVVHFAHLTASFILFLNIVSQLF